MKVDRELHLASAEAMDSNEKFPACPFCDSAAAVRPSRRLPNTRALLSLGFRSALSLYRLRLWILAYPPTIKQILVC